MNNIERYEEIINMTNEGWSNYEIAKCVGLEVSEVRSIKAKSDQSMVVLLYIVYQTKDYSQKQYYPIGFTKDLDAVVKFKNLSEDEAVKVFWEYSDHDGECPWTKNDFVTIKAMTKIPREIYLDELEEALD